MKKLILLCLILKGLMALDSEGSSEALGSQIFVGASVGGADIVKKINHIKDTSNSYQALTWGLRGGYQLTFYKFFALRAYLDYVMGIKPSGLDTITTSMLSLNADLLLNVLFIGENVFGVYGGLGFGYFQHANVVKTTPEDGAFVYGYVGVLNFGVGWTLQNTHRVELGMKIPFNKAQSTLDPSTQPRATYEDMYVSASYSYLF
ncbi:hypothetical protein BKH46_01445 [Helicobacter sp. 12S02634-8]|uniref:outer membrane beta-barrel protein n=1 Tax=Helicobacter sp. 12S02634-8 TaxID=1476199 RepID=UPI000BA69E65|nr:outer membrane beta-barrel protein [Helicobacter sp. 12S02634-8]PAF48004.1 hypothetical protein BKH46_01445 [Helicobacter sp. 12S02634-8]